MATRKIIKKGDELLRKKCREVDAINNKILVLLDDMAQTMYKNEGCGLAACQIGILKRIVVADVGNGLFEMINPVITQTEGEACESEACLSVPNVSGKVIRPKKITVQYTDRNGACVELSAEDYLARCICHEVDHLDGILFTDKIVEEDKA